jgi:hypothetical protein
MKVFRISDSEEVITFLKTREPYLNLIETIVGEECQVLDPCCDHQNCSRIFLKKNYLVDGKIRVHEWVTCIPIPFLELVDLSFYVGEKVKLNMACHGFEVGSVGEIISKTSETPPLFDVDFGSEIPFLVSCSGYHLRKVLKGKMSVNLKPKLQQI